MWSNPKTTLGGVVAWENIRSNPILHLQKHLSQNSALSGIISSVRKIWSDAPTYRIIAVNQPYWEFATGHTQEALDTLMDWLETEAMAKLRKNNVGGWEQGDLDVKIRILVDFMKSFVSMFGTLYFKPLNEAEFAGVIQHMSTAPNLANSQQKAVIFEKPVSPAPNKQPPISSPSPTLVPMTSSQLVTRYERDPVTGLLRAVTVYQPYANANPGYPAAMAPSNHPALPKSGIYPPQLVYMPTQQQYHHPNSQIQHNPHQHQQPSYYQNYPSAYPPQNGSQQQPQAAPYPYPVKPASPSHQAPPQPAGNYYPQSNPYQHPAHNNNPSHNIPPQNIPSQSSQPVQAPQPAPSSLNPSIPISQWDAQKPGAPANSHPSVPSPSVPAASVPQPQPQPSEANPPVKQEPIVPEPSKEAEQSNAESQPSAPVEDEDKNLCKLCLERDLDCAFLPCSHVACYECATTLKLTKCPFCRADIAKVLKLYRS